MNPSQTPVGVFMKSRHWCNACRPFIKDPSYPFADAAAVSGQAVGLRCEARRRTEHDQREDAEVKLQHVCLLIPREAILGQDSEQFTSNGLLRRCVSVLAHLECVEGWWRSLERYDKCQKMTIDAPPAPLNKSSKRACSVSKIKGAVYTPSRTSIKMDKTVTLACPRVADKANPSAERLQKTPH